MTVRLITPLILCCLLLTAVPLKAQESERISNDGFSFRLIDAGERTLFVIDGFAPVVEEEVRIPHRTLRFRMPAAGMTDIVLQDVSLSQPYAASPFYMVHYSWSPDSVLLSDYRAAGSALARQPATAVSVLDRSIRRIGGEVEIALDVPLLTWDPAAGEVRMVEEYVFTRVQRDGLQPAIPAAEDTPPYSNMPFTTRSKNVDTLHAWIDYQGDMLKFHVREDGIYRLTADWMRASGMNPASVNPTGVQLYRKGVAIPLYAEGMEDGSFDDGDAFVFHGTRNYDEAGYRFIPVDKGDPYPQYMSIYTDSTAYWLHFSEADPLRTETDPGMSPLPQDTLDWAMESVHLEVDARLLPFTPDVFIAQDPHWSTHDTWLWTWTGRGGSVTVTAAADHVRPGGTARAWGKLFHWYGDATIRDKNHNLTIQVNDGGVLDSISFAYGGQGLLSGATVSDSIRNGDNTIFIDNHLTVDALSDVAFDWADLDYPRYLSLEQGWKVFDIDSTMNEGPHIIKLQHLGMNDPYVLRVSPDGRVRLLPVAGFSVDDGYTVLVADTLMHGARYFVAVDSTLRLPQPGTVTRIEPLVREDVKTDYLIITAGEFLSACTTYAQFLTDEYGFNPRIVDVQDIYEEYSYGMFQPEAIKLFLFDAYHAWLPDTLGYVFMVGYANYNYKAATSPY